jgi:hypothetical protein
MTSRARKEEKQRRRDERLAQEDEAKEQARRRRLIGFVAAGVLVAASLAAIVVVIAVGGGGGSRASSEAAFGPHYDGLDERREAAGVPTMSEAQTVGAAHFHPQIKVSVNGKQIEVPVNIGISPENPPSEMAGLHTHDSSGIIHNEAGTSAKLRQFFAVWGVPFSTNQLGPYRATKSKKVRMWVDGKPSREFGELQLKAGQEIVVAYGKKSDMPF